MRFISPFEIFCQVLSRCFGLQWLLRCLPPAPARRSRGRMASWEASPLEASASFQRQDAFPCKTWGSMVLALAKEPRGYPPPDWLFPFVCDCNIPKRSLPNPGPRQSRSSPASRCRVSPRGKEHTKFFPRVLTRSPVFGLGRFFVSLSGPLRQAGSVIVKTPQPQVRVPIFGSRSPSRTATRTPKRTPRLSQICQKGMNHCQLKPDGQSPW